MLKFEKMDHYGSAVKENKYEELLSFISLKNNSLKCHYHLKP